MLLLASPQQLGEENANYPTIDNNTGTYYGVIELNDCMAQSPHCPGSIKKQIPKTALATLEVVNAASVKTPRKDPSKSFHSARLLQNI